MEVPATPMSIIASISGHTDAGWTAPADADGPVTIPEPDERPDGHAQWDEAHGRWIIWDAESETWRTIEVDADDQGGDPACWAHLVDDPDSTPESGDQ